MNSKNLFYYCFCSTFLTAFVTRQAFAEEPVYTSDYELIEIRKDEAKDLPNVVVKYEKDETNKYITKYYKLELKTKEYGKGGDTTAEFKWVPDGDTGNYKFDKLEKPDDPTKADITASYNKEENQRENNPEKKEIDRDFVGLEATDGAGGAVNNGWKNENVVLEGDFIGNSAKKEEGEEKSYVSGGAVNNNVDSSITSITGDFVGNFITSPDVSQGGAIYNGSNGEKPSEIGTITGNFIGNYAVAEKEYSQGGAIANMSGKITSVTGDFIGNYVSSENSEAHGGAIINYDNGTIDGGITGDFIDNYAYSANGSADGGAIKNDGYHSESEHGRASIGHIQGDFIQNHAQGKIFASGGAVFNENGAKIDSITGDFIGNYTWSESASSGLGAQGGAVYNFEGSEIGDIKGTFAANYAHSEEGQAHGGAIYNYTNSKLGNIEGDFLLNSATGKTIAHGGAIDNADSKIGTIEGDFIGNSAEGSTDVYGGAIFNRKDVDKAKAQDASEDEDTDQDKAHIGKITGDFIGNYAKGTGSAVVRGGAIDNDTGGKIDGIDGDFIGNYASSENEAHGGAIYNYNKSTMGDIKGSFILNSATGTEKVHGGAIDNANESTIGTIDGDFMGNSAEGTQDVFGGAIYNYNKGKIAGITGDFIGNTALSDSGKAYGGAIYNDGGTLGNISGDFYVNVAQGAEGNGGAIANDSVIGTVHGDFIGNTASQNGGAIYNEKEGKIGAGTEEKGIYNANFYGNIAENGHGGAIYTEADLQIIADGVTSSFFGNKAGAEAEAIYATSEGGVSLTAENGGQFNFFDSINGEEGYTLDLNGDSSGVVNLYNKVTNADIVLDNVTTNVSDVQNFNQNNSLEMKSGVLNLPQFGLTNLKFRNFAMSGGKINIDSVDVDLANQEMGRISADTYAESAGGEIFVKDLNVVVDSDQLQTPVNFADETFAQNVSSPVKKATGKVYRYAVDYLRDTDPLGIGAAGDFLFTRIGYNSAALASPIAMQVGGYIMQIDSYEEAFRNMDMYMLTDKTKPATPQCPGCQGTALYDGIVAQNDSNTAWVRPYSRFEDVSLGQGFNVSQDVYGLYGGIESPMNYLGYCWDAIGSIYGGYVESHQKYDDVKIRQKGGLLGAVGMLYRVNFFTGLDVSFGQSQAKARTSAGHETFDMYTTGIASKTGYNMPFANGKFIVQPNFVMSYSYVDVPDHTNAQGLKIRSKPISAVQLEPGIKLIANLGSGWQPYASASYVRNLHDKTKVKADGLKLPEFETESFMKYKLGLRKTFNDNLVGYLQFNAVDIGREGYGGVVGLRLSF